MQHIDDGTLHTHLDGELDAAGVADVELHLATCSTCRERLDAARVVREKAHSILRLADPPPVSMPDFATLRARRTATAPGPGPATLRPVILAWAASLILALGVGWFAQDLLRGTRGTDSIALTSEAAQLEKAVPQAESAVAMDESPAPSPTLGTADSPPPVTDVDATGGVGVGEVTAPTPAVAPQQAAPAPAPPPRAIPGAADAPMEVAAARTRAAPQDPSEDLAVAPAPPLLAPQGFSAVMAEANVRSGVGWPESHQWSSVDEAGATARLGRPPAFIPGLPIEGFAAATNGSGAVRVIQRLPEGGTLELLQRAASGDTHPAGDTARAAGDALEIEIRTPVAPDSLLLRGPLAPPVSHPEER